MARTVSQTALRAILSQQTGKVFLACLTIDHADLASPLRFVNNTEAITFDSNEYSPAAFEFQAPDDSENNVPEAQITIDNVDRQIIEAIRPLKLAPDIEVNIVMFTDHQTEPSVEMGPLEFKLREFNYNAEIIRGSLRYDETFLNATFPKDRITPTTTPGIF